MLARPMCLSWHEVVQTSVAPCVRKRATALSPIVLSEFRKPYGEREETLFLKLLAEDLQHRGKTGRRPGNVRLQILCAQLVFAGRPISAVRLHKDTLEYSAGGVGNTFAKVRTLRIRAGPKVRTFEKRGFRSIITRQRNRSAQCGRIGSSLRSLRTVPSKKQLINMKPRLDRSLVSASNARAAQRSRLIAPIAPPQADLAERVQHFRSLLPRGRA
jgi:hypothetical protein